MVLVLDVPVMQHLTKPFSSFQHLYSCSTCYSTLTKLFPSKRRSNYSQASSHQDKRHPVRMIHKYIWDNQTNDYIFSHGGGLILYCIQFTWKSSKVIAEINGLISNSIPFSPVLFSSSWYSSFILTQTLCFHCSINPASRILRMTWSWRGRQGLIRSYA